MSPARHRYALRAPWYVLERDTLAWDAPKAMRPALQKYDQAGFVRQVIDDPRRSLVFDDDDVWSFSVPARPPATARGRARLATRRVVRTRLRKLYQPNHDRFYAVVAELFCDAPGLPLPGSAPEVEVRFVLRRERTLINAGEAAVTALRTLGKGLAAQLDHEQNTRPQDAPEVRGDDDVDDVAWIERADGRTFTAEQRALLDVIGPRRVEEAWVLDELGRGRWTTVPTSPDPASPPELVPGEEQLEMWAVPIREGACASARERSLWFAPVPTLSGDRDMGNGDPKLDERSTYRILCLARSIPAPGHEACPPRIGWSAPSEPFRLAAFLDPSGTKNHRVTIVMPDFRALEARAGQAPGPGGVEIVRPPGSQLKFTSDQDGNPTNVQTTDFGAVTSRCTFAIELLMIVAMFLFSLFLPVVVLIFQLWWMLLLRFCLPPKTDALNLLNAHFAAGGTIATLPAVPPAGLAGQKTLDTLLEADGLAAGLAAAPAEKLPPGSEPSQEFVAAIAPATAPPSPARAEEEIPDDPLCPVDPGRRAVS